MNYLLLGISVVIDTIKNTFSNSFSKNVLKTEYDDMMFNCIGCIGAVIFFIISGLQLKISPFSLGMAFIFALTTLAAQYFTLMAMSLGSMSYSVLFTYCGMIIPAIFGIIRYNQPVSALKIVGLVLMIITFYFGTNPKKDKRITGKWLFFGIGSFVFWGLIGILQQLHQESQYAHEMNGFLGYSFFIMFWISLALSLVIKFTKKEEVNFKIKSKSGIYAVISGIFIDAINKINLFLSGAMPSIVFFPIVNGGVIILSSLAAILVFREKLQKSQILGILSGIISVCLLGI